MAEGVWHVVMALLKVAFKLCYDYTLNSCLACSAAAPAIDALYGCKPDLLCSPPLVDAS
jgi:hypothetical protein